MRKRMGAAFMAMAMVCAGVTACSSGASAPAATKAESKAEAKADLGEQSILVAAAASLKNAHFRGGDAGAVAAFFKQVCFARHAHLVQSIQ